MKPSPLVNSERKKLTLVQTRLPFTEDDEQQQAGDARLSTPTGNAGPEALPGGGEAAGPCSLVYVTYLTANGDNLTGEIETTNLQNGEEKESDKSGRTARTREHTAKLTGRHWGVFNRKNLPVAEQKKLFLPMGKWLEHFREKAGEHYAPAGESCGKGFTLFGTDAEDWLTTAEDLNQEEQP